jgi:hypothetical protein
VNTNKDTPKTGSFDYTIDEADADEHDTITINATFTHTDKTLDTIAFTGGTENKTYGDASFTKALTNTGTGDRAISYSSENTAVATVNSSSGAVTIVGAGTAVIKAVKAEDATYAEAEAEYTLFVDKRQLTISGTLVTETKTYDTNVTATVTTVGTLDNVVVGDTVTVTAAATYNSANVADANKITVVYTISGDDIANYNKPVDKEFTGTITQATGAAISKPIKDTVTYRSITVEAINTLNVQIVEYAISLTTTPPTAESDWQISTYFGGLTKKTKYYIHARSKDNGNYAAGVSQVSDEIETPDFDPARATIIDFENFNKAITSTQGNNSATIAITPDPSAGSEKSLKITTDQGNGSQGYNQAAIIPITLPYELKNYESFSFRFYLVSGTNSDNDVRQVMVYAAGTANTFIQYGFGNASGSYQFAANLVGQTPNIDFTNTGKWIDYVIDIVNPGAATPNLIGEIFIAIGINNGTALSYYVDDLTFYLKNDFKLPPSISPKTAEFNNTGGIGTDIAVTMTLNNHTFTGIKIGGNTLDPSNYSESGNIVTLKKEEYLATLPEGNVTLMFTFSGESATTELPLVLKIIPASGATIVTKYVFTDMTNTDSAITSITYYGNNGNNNIEAKIVNNVLRVSKTTGSSYSTRLFVLTFELGSKTLSEFKGIKYKIRGIANPAGTGESDYSSKDMHIEVLKENETTFGNLGSNLVLVSQHATGLSTTFKDITRDFANTAPLSRKGQLKIAFGLNNTKEVYYEFESIELIPND